MLSSGEIWITLSKRTYSCFNMFSWQPLKLSDKADSRGNFYVESSRGQLTLITLWTDKSVACRQIWLWLSNTEWDLVRSSFGCWFGDDYPDRRCLKSQLLLRRVYFSVQSYANSFVFTYTRGYNYSSKQDISVNDQVRHSIAHSVNLNTVAGNEHYIEL